MSHKLNKIEIVDLIESLDLFSANTGLDFQIKLEELIIILDEYLAKLLNKSNDSERNNIINHFFHFCWEILEIKSKEIFIKILNQNKIKEIKLSSWIGPQSIWKWAILKTFNVLLNILNQDIFEINSYLRKNIKNISPIKTKEQNEIIDFISSIVWKNGLEIKTWTGWIMRPSSDSHIEKIYAKYIRLEKYTDQVTGSWNLFDNNWMNWIVLMEINSALLSWKSTSLTLDVWPRTQIQLEFIKSLTEKCKYIGVNMDLIIFQLEPILSSNHLQETHKFKTAIADLRMILESFIKYINLLKIWSLDDYRANYFSDSKWFIPKESLIYYFISDELLLFAKRSQKKRTFNNPVLDELINWISILLKRVWNRVYCKNRKDDLDYTWYLKRLLIYYTNTHHISWLIDWSIIIPAWWSYELTASNQIDVLLNNFGKALDENSRIIIRSLFTLTYLWIVVPK